MADTNAAVVDTEDQKPQNEAEVVDTSATESQQDQETEQSETPANVDGEAEVESSEAEAETGESQEESQDKQEKPQKTKEDYINERIARREAKQIEALRRQQQEYQASMDPNDWEQRVQAIENERYIERVEANIMNAKRDIADIQNLPVFKDDPELLNEVMSEMIDTYGQFHDEIKDQNGDNVFLGFYDPKTGQPISVKQVALAQARRLERAAERAAEKARLERSKGEAKMQAVAETPYHTGTHPRDKKETLEEMKERLSSVTF